MFICRNKKLYEHVKILIESFGGPQKGRFSSSIRLFKGDIFGLSLALGLSLLGQKNSLDVGEDTSLGNGDSSQKFVQLLVVTDSQLQVTGDDPSLLVVTGSIASQLKDLSRQVLHNGSQVDRGTGSNTLSIVALPQETMNTTDGELKSSPG
jgi:hypothetical protein